MLAKALARSIDCTVRRIQFTPDLLPSDVTGVSVFDQETRDFEFRPGAVFANIVVGDEINRASPEDPVGAARVHGGAAGHRRRHDLPAARPFMVIATQNPVEMEGTYPLPEAQRDRFMARVSMGYPEHARRDGHARRARAHDPLDDLDAGGRRRARSPADRGRARASTSPTRSGGTPSTSSPHAPAPRPPSRRLAARDAAPAARGEGGRRARRPRLRAARRRAGARRRRCSRTGCCLTADAQIAGRTTESVVADIVRRVPVPAAARV